MLALLLIFQYLDAGFQFLQLQRFSLLDGPGVQCLDAPQHIAHGRCLGRVEETMLFMPAGQRRQVGTQSTRGKLFGMLRQVARYTGVTGRQQPAPFPFEMFDHSRIAADGAFTPTGLTIALGIAHALVLRTASTFINRRFAASSLRIWASHTSVSGPLSAQGGWLYTCNFVPLNRHEIIGRNTARAAVTRLRRRPSPNLD
ncbi:hypothetical protein D3C81_1105320 [compost metagenome]